VVERIRLACAEGRQVYWVCTLIEESEDANGMKIEAQAAQATFEALSQALPELRVGLLHGRMKPVEKAQVMASFKAGELHLLVATTVIEVGVDVPNASLMVIENAERMGLAQLHQLRGRVGRGSQESSCVLLYRAPLSQMARERLAAIRDSNDGFEIARKDLELRGPGELLGTRQTGLATLRVADLIRNPPREVPWRPVLKAVAWWAFATLPAPLRAAYGVPWSALRAVNLAGSLRTVRLVRPFLPGVVREIFPARQAARRMAEAS
jgi:ATP-dependent DNA helicase RecG